MNVINIFENGTVTQQYCKNRYCPTSNYIRFQKLKFIIEEILNNFNNKTLLFVTVTNKKVKVKTIDEVKALREAMAKGTAKLMKDLLDNQNGYF